MASEAREIRILTVDDLLCCARALIGAEPDMKLVARPTK